MSSARNDNKVYLSTSIAVVCVSCAPPWWLRAMVEVACLG